MKLMLRNLPEPLPILTWKHSPSFVPFPLQAEDKGVCEVGSTWTHPNVNTHVLHSCQTLGDFTQTILFIMNINSAANNDPCSHFSDEELKT